MKVFKRATVLTLVQTLMAALFFASAQASEANFNEEFPHLRISSEEGKTEFAGGDAQRTVAQAETTTTDDDTTATEDQTVAPDKKKMAANESKFKSMITNRYHRICLGRQATKDDINNFMTYSVQELMALRQSAECNTPEATARRQEMMAKLKAHLDQIRSQKESQESATVSQ